VEIEEKMCKSITRTPCQDDRTMHREIYFIPKIPEFSLPWQQGSAWDRF